MVSFLKNFALGVATQINTNANTAKAQAQKQADELRSAKLQLDINKELTDFKSKKELAAKKDELKYTAKLKQDQLDAEMTQYQGMMNPDATMPTGGVVQTPGQPVPQVTSTDLAPLPNTPQANTPHPSTIDEKTDYTTASDDPEVNEAIRQYQFALAKRMLKALPKHTWTLLKLTKKAQENDPTVKAGKEVTQKLAKRDALIAQGYSKAQAEQAALNIKPPSEDDTVYTRKYREKADVNSLALSRASELRDFMVTNPGVMKTVKRLKSAGHDFTSQFELTNDIANGLGLTDPNEVKALQKYTTLYSELNGVLKKPLSGGDSSISKMDTATVDSALGNLGGLFTSEDRALAAVDTIYNGLIGEVEDSYEKLSNPSIGGQVNRLKEQLDAAKGTPRPVGPPTVSSKEDATYKALKPGDSYIGPDGLTAIKQ